VLTQQLNGISENLTMFCMVKYTTKSLTNQHLWSVSVSVSETLTNPNLLQGTSDQWPLLFSKFITQVFIPEARQSKNSYFAYVQYSM
jgi:hypothetical protein